MSDLAKRLAASLAIQSGELCPKTVEAMAQWLEHRAEKHDRIAEILAKGDGRDFITAGREQADAVTLRIEARAMRKLLKPVVLETTGEDVDSKADAAE